MIDFDESIDIGVSSPFPESLVRLESNIRFIQLVLPLAALIVYKDFKLIKGCYA